MCGDDILKYKSDLENNSCYKIIKKLGSGAQGTVLLVQKDKEIYAAKVFSHRMVYEEAMPDSSDEESADIEIGESACPLFEIRFGLLMNHPYIVKGIDFVVGDEYIYYIMEKADLDLGNFLIDRKFTSSEKIQNIFKLACGLEYIHQLGMVHGDVKSINVLLKSGSSSNVTTSILLSDFGLITLVEDLDPDKAFQTLNYRAPEHISIDEDMDLRVYNSIFDKKTRTLYKKNYKLSESWSLGILCLDIMYNCANVSLSIDINKSEFAKEYYKGKRTVYPYNILINVLSKLHDPNRYPEIKGETSFTIIKKILGNVSHENQPLLKLICDKLLIVDQTKRASIQEFLQNDFFVSRGLYVSGDVNHFNFPKVKNMYTPIEDRLYYVGVLIEWLVNISNDLELYPIIIMNCIDYIIQRSHNPDFFDDISKIQLFGMCVMWIMTKLYSYDCGLNIILLRKTADNFYSALDIYEMILKILKYEKGSFLYESIYFQLPSEQLLLKAIKIMKNPKEYISYESPSNLAFFLLKEESHEEMKSRTPKQFKKFQILI